LDRLCLVALLSTLDKRPRHPVPRHRAEPRPVVGPQDTGGVAEARRFFQHRVEHRREVAWRALDDLQYLGGRGLLFQRLVTLGFALGKLTSQISYELLGLG
jgi:hypothetical protein